jgi:hypothetical protein
MFLWCQVKPYLPLHQVCQNKKHYLSWESPSGDTKQLTRFRLPIPPATTQSIMLMMLPSFTAEMLTAPLAKMPGFQYSGITTDSPTAEVKRSLRYDSSGIGVGY